MKPVKSIVIVAISFCALVLLALGGLFLVRQESIVTSVQNFFDKRQNLSEVASFEPFLTQELLRVEITVQSETYPSYTEEKTIENAAELEAFLTAISTAKLVENAEDTDDTGESGSTLEPVDFTAELVDVYTFELTDESITLYTKANDATFICIDGIWQEIDYKTADSFYTIFLESSSELFIYDETMLRFYPQTWEVGENELAQESYGIDVSYHQGVIDWAQVAQDGVDFAIVRVGLRYAESGVLAEDILARYNMQEASANGIAVGVYFFSTAATEEEALEEAAFVLDIISGYPITYPIVYNCEMFDDSDNRHSSLTVEERSHLADVFLSAIEAEGYTGMFYASKNELTANTKWETNYLQSEYRIWVAQYPGDETGATPEGTSTYTGRHEMWQYTSEAQVAGISGTVDRNVAYFSYAELATPKGEAAAEVSPDYDALAGMQDVSESVTAKEYANVRSAMDSTDDSNIVGTLSNGEVVTRIGVGTNGWSKIEFDGGTAYVITSLLTTDISSSSNTSTGTDGEFTTEFTTVSELVTAKEITNLRNMPSVTDAESVVVATLTNGEVITRTGVSDEGFSRVEYQGQTLYCVSSYLEVVE